MCVIAENDMFALKCAPEIGVAAFCLGKLLRHDPWESDGEFNTVVEGKKWLQETGGTRESRVRKTVFIWKQNIMGE